MDLISTNNGTTTKVFTPYDTSYTSSDITEGSIVTMNLSGSSISNSTLKAYNDYAKAVIATTDDVVWSGTVPNNIPVFTVPTYQNIATHLSDAEKQSYEAGAVTIDYVFKLIADDAMTNTITIRVTYTKPTRASFNLRRPTETTTISTEIAPVSTEDKSLTTSAGVGDILN